jgi:hypothetical protein
MKKISLIKQIRYLTLVALTLTAFGMSAQDLHFSQFQNSPLNHNPALTGIFSGDQRFASYRRQWFSAGGYMTFTGSYDRTFKRTGQNFFSGGLLFDYDKAGQRSVTAYLGINDPIPLAFPKQYY